jgi:urea transport system substrate-binding protein
MARKFRRREILILGSTAAGSVLLKACTPNAPTTTAPSASGSPSPSASGASPAAATGDGIKVGLLHSLSGTMAISEKSVVDAEQLAIEEINKAGGVLTNYPDRGRWQIRLANFQRKSQEINRSRQSSYCLWLLDIF